MYWSIDENKNKIFHRAEGKVIFSHVFYDVETDNYNGKIKKKNPLMRLVVHHQGTKNFLVIHQLTMIVEEKNKWVQKNLGDATWQSYQFIKLNLHDLLAFIDSDFYPPSLRNINDIDKDLLPFLLRQSLLQHGFEVDDIVDHPMSL